MKDARREIIKKAEDKIEAARIEAAETGQKLQRGWVNQVMKKAEIEADSHPDAADLDESDIPRIDPKEIRHWWIQKPTRHNCPLETNGAVFEEFEPTRREQNCEWVKVYSADDLHAKIGINISRYVNVMTALHSRKSQAAEMEKDERLERSVKWWMSKVYCPYKAPELRSELALEAFAEFHSILNPPALKQKPAEEGEDE